jgi:DNA-binding IclR family transcriptional regulator
MVREGWEQVVIQVQPSLQPVRYVFEVASRGPIYNGAAGQAILAHLADEEVERLVAETGLAPTTDNSIASVKQLHEKLESIREQGFGVSFGERIPEAASAAAPVFGANGDVKAALSIVMPLSRATERHIGECARVAKRAAGQVSDELKNYQVS